MWELAQSHPKKLNIVRVLARQLRQNTVFLMFFRGREAKTRLKLGRCQNAIKCIQGCSFEGPWGFSKSLKCAGVHTGASFSRCHLFFQSPPRGSPRDAFWSVLGLPGVLPGAAQIV